MQVNILYNNYLRKIKFFQVVIFYLDKKIYKRFDYNEKIQ